jgi:hypothetical protein
MLARGGEIFLEARSGATKSRPYPTGLDPSGYGAVDVLKLHSVAMWRGVMQKRNVDSLLYGSIVVLAFSILGFAYRCRICT